MQRTPITATPTKAEPPERRSLSIHAIRLMLLLLYLTTPTNGNPISIAEASNKSGKNIGSTSSSASLMIKPSAHDAQLNSLNAYAINYGQIAAESSNNAAQGVNTNSFKPSYKLPELENNFTPIQTQNSGITMPHAAPLTAASPNINSLTNNNIQQPTPVLMQYIPQAVPEGGIQYLQLIPTRPLIVPISPYLNGNVQPTVTQVAANESLHPPLAAAINSGTLDYGAPAPPILTPEPINNNVVQQQLQQQHAISGATQTLIEVSHTAAAAAQPYGLQTYANNIQPYRSSYRINREVKGKNFPGTMSLNMNEYIPGPNEALRPLYVRGRP